MPTVSLQHTVVGPKETVYQVIADIERYPEFMPGFVAIETRRAGDDALDVWQTVGLGRITRRFKSHARFTAPTQIHITSTESPFRRLDQQWRCQSHGRTTRVELHAEYTLSEPMLGPVFNRVYPELLRRGLAAIETRVRRLQGHAQH